MGEMKTISTIVLVPCGEAPIPEIWATALRVIRESMPVVYNFQPGEFGNISEPKIVNGERVREYEVIFKYEDTAQSKTADPVDLDLVMESFEVPALGDMPSYDGELN